MIFKEFLLQYNGQKNVGNTTENTGECVGLVAVWVDALGLSHIWGHAMDLFSNADEKYFEKILNTPEAIPQERDIVVWGKAFNGTFGHTGIATGTGDTNSFECFEQNDPLGSNCHLKTYKYTSVIGWLRPSLSQNSSTIIQQSDSFIAVCTELGVTATKDAAITAIKAKNTRIDELEELNQAKERKNTELAEKATELEKRLSDATSYYKALLDNYTASQKVLEEKITELNGLTTENKELQEKIKQEALTPIEHLLKAIKGFMRR